MFIPASSEFVALCQSQVAVLTQGLGAALSAVYLTTEELVEGIQPKLIPVVVYPEAAAVWEEDNTDLVLPDRIDDIDTIPQLVKAAPRLLPQTFDNDQQVDSTSSNWDENSLDRQRQIVLPLIHEGVVMGLLVTGREDRPWNEREKVAIERIARTLTIAYLMDQRRAWFEQHLTQQRRLHAQQRDLLDDLLHQFRNPLTALRTFGKLLLKRFLPGDKNQEVASSIVRESDRLQELLQQFDECLDMYAEDSTPLTLPVTAIGESCPLPANEDEMIQTVNSTIETGAGVLSLLPGKALNLESFSVTDVLEPLLISAKAIAQERDLDLLYSIPSDLPLVRGNAKALREVLNNLIDNALKYTPAGGEIDIQVGIGEGVGERERGGEGVHPKVTQIVSIRDKGDKGDKEDSTKKKIYSCKNAMLSGERENSEMMGIAICDTGPGIPPEDLEHLFERHYRGVQAGTSIPGTGLGLAIAKELVEQMQGEIEVFSPAQSLWAKQNSDCTTIGNTQDHLAKGTTFVIWLVISD
ncbi:MAG TPA: histidine kinase [Cyanobacteria bacterium UBA11370]|nr:histidine kinase [Cyanobacteria bacterium UBA11370]